LLQDWQIWVNKQTANKIINQDKILQKKKKRSKNCVRRRRRRRKRGKVTKSFVYSLIHFKGRQTNKQGKDVSFILVQLAAAGTLGPRVDSP